MMALYSLPYKHVSNDGSIACYIDTMIIMAMLNWIAYKHDVIAIILHGNVIYHWTYYMVWINIWWHIYSKFI